VTVELARRLMRGGVIGTSEFEATLLDAAKRGLALIQILAEQRPDLLRPLERELERSAGAALQSVRAAPELASRLPPGMCERLLAVPLLGDSRGSVEVACVDPGDPHVRAEFSFHLQQEVKTRRAPLSEIASAIEGLHAGGSFLVGVSRVLGTAPAPETEPAPAGAATAGPPQTAGSGSEPPIPLVRRSLAPRARTAASVAPAASDALLKITAVEAEPAQPAPGPPPAAARAAGRDYDPSAAIRAFDKFDTADEILESLLVALAELSERAALFAVKATTFEGRLGRGRGVSEALLRATRLSRDAPSALQAAAQSGHFLGRLTQLGEDTVLRDLLAADDREVYAVRLSISERPAIVAVISGFENAFSATRAAGEIAAAAGRALERVLRSKKARR
jgi:hypothetical protein